MSAVVTQADREVLKAIYAPAAHEAIDAGDYDSHQDAQAIARHRSEAVEELVEVLERILSDEDVALSRPDYELARTLISKHRGEQG